MSASDAGTSDTHDASAACDPGSTTTQWASNCQSAPASTCLAGTWTDPGSTTNDPLVCQSAHFAVHAPSGTITQQQCSDATNTLETVVWPAYFGAPFFFPEPYCASTKKYKASIVVRSGSGLTGGGWGQGYMGMWIGPGATADHWGLAHEFMHAVQSTTKGMACGGDQNYCGWIWESHANFMAHQLPEYRGEVHCSEMLVNAPHLYLGSTRDRYCNWQFMEFLKDRYCPSAVNDIWTAPKQSNDPFSNIASTRGWSLEQLNDFFGDWAMHNVTWDYQNLDGSDQGAVYRKAYGALDDTKPERSLRLTQLDALDDHYVVNPQQAPQRWGYDVIELESQAEVTVTFRGVQQDDADFRWGLVSTDAALAKARYSALQRGSDGELTFCSSDARLFLVVVATPNVQQHINWDQPYPTIRRYPYMLGFANTKPKASSNTGKVWSNGGGYVASGATVADGAYVGPRARVLSGKVGASARIEDHATVAGGTVNSGSVGGVSVVLPGFTIGGSARVALAWPYGPGWFEKPVSIAGTAQYLGDLELRGDNVSKASGRYCGIADETTNDNCSQPDVTAPPPYQWR